MLRLLKLVIAMLFLTSKPNAKISEIKKGFAVLLLFRIENVVLIIMSSLILSVVSAFDLERDPQSKSL